MILFKKSGESLAPFALNLIKNAFILPLFLLTILLYQGWEWPQMPLRDWLLVLVSGFLGIAAGDTLYFRALNMIGPGRLAAAQTLYSPFVILLALAFLGEHLRLGQIAGVVLVLAGIGLVTYTRAGTQLDPRRMLVGAAWAVLAVFLMALGVVIAKPMLEQHDFLWVVTLRIGRGAPPVRRVARHLRGGSSLGRDRGSWADRNLSFDDAVAGGVQVHAGVDCGRAQRVCGRVHAAADRVRAQGERDAAPVAGNPAGSSRCGGGRLVLS